MAETKRAVDSRPRAKPPPIRLRPKFPVHNKNIFIMGASSL